MMMWYVIGGLIAFAIMYIYLIASDQIDTDDTEELVGCTFLTLVASTVWPLILPLALMIVGSYHLGVYIKEWNENNKDGW